MLAFPVHPRHARMLLAAEHYGCVYHACLVAALTQGRDLLVRKPERTAALAREDIWGRDAASDFWVMMQAWEYASRQKFRPDALRSIGIHGVTARQVAPMFEQFLRNKRAIWSEARAHVTRAEVDYYLPIL